MSMYFITCTISCSCYIWLCSRKVENQINDVDKNIKTMNNPGNSKGIFKYDTFSHCKVKTCNCQWVNSPSVLFEDTGRMHIWSM